MLSTPATSLDGTHWREGVFMFSSPTRALDNPIYIFLYVSKWGKVRRETCQNVQVSSRRRWEVRLRGAEGEKKEEYEWTGRYQAKKSTGKRRRRRKKRRRAIEKRRRRRRTIEKRRRRRKTIILVGAIREGKRESGGGGGLRRLRREGGGRRVYWGIGETEGEGIIPVRT